MEGRVLSCLTVRWSLFQVLTLFHQFWCLFRWVLPSPYDCWDYGEPCTATLKKDEEAEWKEINGWSVHHWQEMSFFFLLLFSSKFLITLLFSCLNRLHFTNSITPEISSQVYFSSLCLQVENVRKKKAKNCVWSYNRTLKIILWGKKQSKKFTKTCCGPRDVPGINQSIKSTINE